MTVRGGVDIRLHLNVYNLETDAVEVNDGVVKIVDDEQFFMDWCENWEEGIGELSGASVESTTLEMEEQSMAWIKLHLVYDGRDVYANTKNITNVNKDCSDSKDVTCISFAGETKNYIRVTESVEEVMAKIRDAIGEY